MYRLFSLLLILVFIITATACEPRPDAAGQEKPISGGLIVGGACEYALYEGTAIIVRVEQTADSKAQVDVVGGAGCPGYEVWFTFETAAHIEQEWVRKAVAKEHLLLLKNRWYVGEKYVAKYGITEQSRHPCTVQVITKGTCTPIIFTFDEIDTTDYFESQ